MWKPLFLSVAAVIQKEMLADRVWNLKTLLGTQRSMMLFIKDPSSTLKWQHYTVTTANSVVNPAFWVLSSTDPAFYTELGKKCAATSPSGHGRQWTEPCPPNHPSVPLLLLISSQRKVPVVLSQQEKIMWRKPGHLLVHRGDRLFHKPLQPFNTGIWSNSGLAQKCWSWREILMCLKGGKGAWWEPCCTSQIQHIQISSPAGHRKSIPLHGEACFCFTVFAAFVMGDYETWKTLQTEQLHFQTSWMLLTQHFQNKLPVRTTFFITCQSMKRPFYHY